MNVVSFVIPGAPQGKGRARVGRVNGQARMFTPAKTIAYESLVAMAARDAMRGAEPFSGPVALDLVLVYAIPPSWSRKRRQEAEKGLLVPVTKPDIDNVVKSVGDGANGIAWADDRQIARLTAVRRYGVIPCVQVVAAELSTE